MKWLITVCLLFFVALGVFTFYSIETAEAPAPNETLYEMDGYIYYLQQDNQWIFTTITPAEQILPTMTYADVEAIVEMENVHIINIAQPITDFTHGDAVTIWVYGVMESYPTQVSPKKIQHR